jgi:hypothetical protein
MTAQLAPQPVFQAFTPNGDPLVGGQLFTYIAGTSTPQASYVDSTQTTPNTNPVILNSMGQANVWLVTSQTYKLVLQDSAGNPQWSVDQVPGGFNITAAIIGALLYPRTAREIVNNVTPSNYVFPGGNLIGGANVFRYGAAGNGVADDSSAFLQAQLSATTFSVPEATGYLTNTALTGTYAFIAQGNPTYSGTNPLLAWAPVFGGTLQVAQTGGLNGFVSMVRNSLPASSVAQPTAVTGYARVDNSGNVGFGLFGRADLYGATGVATNEVNSFNWSANPATAAFPPNRSIGTTQTLPIAFTVAFGGSNTSCIGIQIAKEGGNPQKGLCGIYINPDAIAATGFGIFVDADATSTQTLSALLKHKVGVQCVQFQGVGTPVPSNNVIGYVDGAGATKWTLQESGQMFFSYNQGGWGTPTGAAVVINYSGAGATLGQTSNAVAQIIISLKALGLFGA